VAHGGGDVLADQLDQLQRAILGRVLVADEVVHHYDESCGQGRWGVLVVEEHVGSFRLCVAWMRSGLPSRSPTYKYTV
jgi:hypothetical protein